jgi:hypothetical protein
MVNIITALFSQLKNPWQYICIAVAWIAFLYYEIDYKYIIPTLIGTIGVASVLQHIYKIIMRRINKSKTEKHVLNHLRNLSPQEQSILYEALVTNKSNTSEVGYKTMAYAKSLRSKGILHIPGGSYMMNPYSGIPIIITNVAMELINLHRFIDKD